MGEIDETRKERPEEEETPDEIREELREKYGDLRASEDDFRREQAEARRNEEEPQSEFEDRSHNPRDESESTPTETSEQSDNDREQIREHLKREYGSDVREEDDDPKATDPRESVPAGEKPERHEATKGASSPSDAVTRDGEQVKDRAVSESRPE